MARLRIESELVLDGPMVRHTLDAIYFDPQQLDDRFELGMHDGDIVEAKAAMTTTATPRGGYVTIAAHELAIALGDYHYELLEARAADRGGLRGTVGALTLCPLVAAGVANKCGTAACVVALPAIAELCERGLDAIMGATRDEVTAVTVRFGGGAATLLDHDGDAIADALEGWWDAAEAFPAAQLSFTARRPLGR